MYLQYIHTISAPSGHFQHPKSTPLGTALCCSWDPTGTLKVPQTGASPGEAVAHVRRADQNFVGGHVHKHVDLRKHRPETTRDDLKKQGPSIIIGLQYYRWCIDIDLDPQPYSPEHQLQENKIPNNSIRFHMRKCWFYCWKTPTISVWTYSKCSN